MTEKSRVLLAFDKFRGSMTAVEACRAAAQGLTDAGIESVSCPLSDGGDGFVEAIAFANDATPETFKVSGPLNDMAFARVLFLDPGPVAIIESAHACGLALLKPEDRNPESTSTYGVGQLILLCDAKPVSKIILGIGGSATNDGGAGMLSALGWHFSDEDGNPFVPTGGTLNKIAKIERGPVLSTPITVALDVTNRLCGPEGAAYVFARQKGADDAMVERLDSGLKHYAEKMLEATSRDYSLTTGSGAAGGLGFALMHLAADMQPGAATVMKLVNFSSKLKDCKVCITGEGSFDSQSRMGKLPMAVAEACKQSDTPCFLLAGAVKGETSELPFSCFASINPADEPLEDSLINATENMRVSAMELGKKLANPPSHQER